jgi:UPF0716 protein FxsA
MVFSCTFDCLRNARQREMRAKSPSEHGAPLKWVLFALLILPAAELAAFIAVAVHIGILPAFALMLATSVLGIALLRLAGKGKIAQVRVTVTEGKVQEIGGAGPGSSAGRAFFTVIGGILLVLPGFLTDVLGLLVLLPPVQQRLHAALGRVLKRQSQSRDGVIDLEPGEWAEDEVSRPPPRDLLQP